MAPVRVRETCKARVPKVDLKDVSPSKVDRHMHSLLSLACAAIILRMDVDLFIKRVADVEGREAFAKGACHHLQILLAPTLAMYRQNLESVLEVMVENIFVHGREAKINDLLEYAETEMSRLEASIEHLRKLGTMDKGIFKIQVGDDVPTASPRQILVLLLTRHPEFQEKIETEGVKNVLAKISENLSLPVEIVMEGLEFKGKPPKVEDGTAHMFFLSYRGHKAIVGASQERWGSLSAIRKIRREDRDHRLGEYIRPAANALVEFQKIEENVVLPSDTLPRNKKYERRRLAIQKAKDEPGPYFLDRTRDLGQAFNGEKEYQCCFLCQGMLGYRTAKDWAEQKIRQSIVQFNWRNREGYAHSCAEVDASLQYDEMTKTSRDIKESP